MYNTDGTKLPTRLYQGIKLLSIGMTKKLGIFVISGAAGGNGVMILQKEIRKTYLSSCPVCGRTLFRGTPDSCIEGGCPKCREYLKIDFYDTGYRVSIVSGENGMTADGA